VNADDLIAGPITYTIREVINGKAESPFDFLLVEIRPRLPTQQDHAPRHRQRLGSRGQQVRRPTTHPVPRAHDHVRRQKVGGIRISHMSHIDGPVEVLAQVTRGKREKFVVDPLPDAPQQPPEPTAEDVAACTDLAALKAMWATPLDPSAVSRSWRARPTSSRSRHERAGLSAPRRGMHSLTSTKRLVEKTRTTTY
jgi:hypothetical protein